MASKRRSVDPLYELNERVYGKNGKGPLWYPATVKAFITNPERILVQFDDGTELELAPKHVVAESRMKTSERSRSPGRTRSRSRSRSRSRGRARSRSPARKAKQSPSPSRKTPAKSSSSSRQKKAPTTPVRQSARLMELSDKQEDDQKLQNSEPVEKPGSKREKKEQATRDTSFKYEFGGPCGAFLMTIGLPATVLLINLACGAKSCTLQKLPTIPLSLAAYLDPRAILLFVGWMLFQVLLAVVPWGRVARGQPLKSGGRLSYRCNGFIALGVSLITLGGLIYLGYPVTVVYDKFTQLAVTAMAFSCFLSVGLYIRSRSIAAKYRAAGGSSGNPVYDFFMGGELNPRVGPLDLKFFCELRPGLIGWVMLNAAFVLKAHSTGTLTPALVAVSSFQALYVADALFFEDSILTTMDIVHDGFGFMLAFGDLCWVPFLYCLQTRYLLEHPVEWHPAAILAFVLLNLLGYIVFRGANSQKDRFRKDPHNPLFASFSTIPTPSGKKLLASGWWGLSRHPNYLGDLIMALAWSLPCGCGSALPYFYPVYFLALLLHRAARDDAQCRAKHGQAWDRYCREVPARIVPYVY